MRVPFRHVVLDALVEERDHLKVRLSLIEKSGLDTKGSATDLREAVARLEARIAELTAPR